MAKTIAGDTPRYKAFISYSHQDVAFARRLHRKLEAYRLPGRLVGRNTARGLVPARLAPVFRDRDEFPAAADLSAELLAALADSGALIVLCTPAAAASPWVAREIEVFQSLHPDRPVLAVLRRGAPLEAFPEALRPKAGDGGPIEPLAADFRKNGDGWRLGLLKLIAGATGLGLDSLVQRDAQRRLRNVTAVTVTSIIAMLAMGLLTIFALQARADAERQRAQAEGLVEFMLTDLRSRLEGVGRLDVLTAVNRRALSYYAEQDLDQLPAASLERRARVLDAMGEDDEARGDFPAAAAQFDEASRTTAVLLKAAPNDPDRIYGHAQSAFWVGTIAFNAGRKEKARRSFLDYKRLADRLVAIAPRNAAYRRELAYAEGDLCSVALMRPVEPATAVRWCTAALADMQGAARGLGARSGIEQDLISRRAWLADAYRASGDLARAREQRLAQEQALDALIAADPKNMSLRSDWVSLQNALASLDFAQGQTSAGRERLQSARDTLDEMIAYDPKNWVWAKKRAGITARLKCLHSPDNDHQTGALC
jgi:tetratricopeptide (TPR) repeat protein